MTRPDPTTGAEYADSVQEVLERAAEAEAARGQKSTPSNPALSSGPVLGGVALVFAAVVFYNVQALSGPAVPVTPEEAEVSSGISVMIATQAIEAYREEHGRLPESLEELGFPTGSLNYQVEGDTYRLIVSVDGHEPVEFSPEEEPLRILEEMGVTLGRPPGEPEELPE